MANKPQLPTVDYVQIFCTNFKSHLDLSGDKSRRISDFQWSNKFEIFDGRKNIDPKDKLWPVGDILQLRISRYTLEVLQLVLLDESGQRKDLAKAILEFYEPSPMNKICRCDLIAKALTDANLVSTDQNNLAEQVAIKVQKWLDEATEVSKKLFPDIGDFKGKTGWILENGMVLWGPLLRIKEVSLGS